MSLFIASLNSGSNGNCYYVGTHDEAVLVDVGISCREVERRMQRLGLDMAKVKGILISHEHSDHIRGVQVLAKRYRLPVYIGARTYRNSGLQLSEVVFFEQTQSFRLASFRVEAFAKRHDACEPSSFTLTANDITVGVFTDIGVVCENVLQHFTTCNAAFLEANYDLNLLENGTYPYHLKRRIKSGWGHLSNDQALALFRRHRPKFMSHLVLSHLSKDNNCPSLVKNAFQAFARGTEIIVASRDAESRLFEVRTPQNHLASTTLSKQLSLFG